MTNLRFCHLPSYISSASSTRRERSFSGNRELVTLTPWRYRFSPLKSSNGSPLAVASRKDDGKETPEVKGTDMGSQLAESTRFTVSGYARSKLTDEEQTLESLPDAIPRWFLIGGVSLGIALLALGFDGHGEAMALGPEGPLVEEFWDNMRRYALYALTVSTGMVYTIAVPIFELLKNPITAILILIVIAGSGFVVSQVLNAMVGNSDFTYYYG